MKKIIIVALNDRGDFLQDVFFDSFKHLTKIFAKVKTTKNPLILK